MSRILLIALVALVALLAVDQMRKLFPAEKEVAGAESQGARAAPAPLPVTRSAAVIPPDSGPSAVDIMARAEGRRLLQRSAGITYVDSLFLETDSIVRRWPDLRDGPLLIALAESGDPAGDARLVAVVSRAVQSWREAAPGVRVVVADDTAGVPIVLQFVDHLEADRAGQTDLRWTRDGAIHGALITVALETGDGTGVPDEGLFAVVSHEVGHALGLPHSSSPLDVMFPTTRTGYPTERDARSLRLLYELPLGSMKENSPE